MTAPLFVTRDDTLLDELLRLAAAAGVTPDVAHDGAAALRGWAAAPLRTVIDGRTPDSSSSVPAARATSPSAWRCCSSSIVACTPPNGMNSCGGNSARISTPPPVFTARRAAKRSAISASGVSSITVR